MPGALPHDEELLDLLVSRVTEGLTPAQTARLAEQLQSYEAVGPDCLEHAAAAAAVVFVRADPRREPMPQSVKNRIVERAHSAPATTRADVVYLQDRRVAAEDRAPTARRPWLSAGAIGWYAAAALALVMVLPGLQQPGEGPAPTLDEQRAALLASAADVITVPWMPSEQAGYEQVSGDVIWSDAAQQGFLRLAGLPVNQPTAAQYQLWIIDPDRDEQPVDGGVFDIASSGEVLIPIQAKLAVTQPQAFALTLEQPGGVVVSEGPLLVVAAVGPRPG